MSVAKHYSEKLQDGTVHQQRGQVSSVPNNREAGVVAPVYKLEINAVQDACVKACLNYFHRMDKDDRLGRTIFVNNNNFWAGDTDVNIALVETSQGVQVKVESHGAGFNQPLWNRSQRDLAGFYSALDNEIRHHLELAKPGNIEKTTEERLRELKALLDGGLISDEEYEQKRTEVLKNL